MSRLDAEVLVVGAGPSGAWTARRLAEAGRDVLLADENEGPRTDVVCTGIVGTEAFGRLPLPAGAVTDVVRRAFFFSPGGRAVPYEPSRPLARVVDRTRFDEALAGEAQAAGARLLRGHAAREVRKTSGGVAVRCLTSGGERTLRARALVVATGHQRWLHEAAGLGTPDRYVHGVHADLPFAPLEGAELYFGNGVAPGFFAWAVPFGDGTARLGVLAPQGGRRFFLEFLSREPIRERLGPEVRRALEEGAGDGGADVPAGTPDPGDVPAGTREGSGRRSEDGLRSRLRSRGIVQGPVSPSYADRVLAVGEAAGQVKTTTAGGIYYGMLGAEMAASVLDDALDADRLDAGSLSAYEAMWRQRLGPEIDMGLRLQEAVRGLEDHQIERVFGALQGGAARVLRRVVRFDWHRPALRFLLSGVLGAAAGSPGAAH